MIPPHKKKPAVEIDFLSVPPKGGMHEESEPDGDEPPQEQGSDPDMLLSDIQAKLDQLKGLVGTME